MLDHFTHLFRFRVIVEQGSMRRAAEALAVTQPALTRSIAILEAHYDKPLLHRHARGVQPTEFGKRLLASVRRLMRHWDIAEADLAQSEGEMTGTLTVRAGPLWRTVILPEVLTALQEAFPNLTIELDNGGPSDTSRDLAEGRIDVIFGGLQLGSEGISGIVWRPFTTINDRVVARETHPIFDRRLDDGSVDIRRVLDYPWIVYTTHPIYELETIHGTAERLGASPDIRVRTNSLIATMGLLQRGDYLCVLPQAAAQFMTNPAIVPVPVDLGQKAIQSGAMYRDENADWPPLALLLGLCESYFAKARD